MTLLARLVIWCLPFAGEGVYPAGGRCDVAGAPATVGTHGAPHLRHGHHTDVRLRGGSVLLTEVR